MTVDFITGEGSAIGNPDIPRRKVVRNPEIASGSAVPIT